MKFPNWKNNFLTNTTTLENEAECITTYNKMSTHEQQAIQRQIITKNTNTGKTKLYLYVKLY